MWIPDEALPYITMQRASCKSVAAYKRLIAQELQALRSHLPISLDSYSGTNSPPPRGCMVDIGCGIAGITALIAKLYPSPHVVLIDRTVVAPHPRYGFREASRLGTEGQEYYSSLSIARSVVERNALDAVVSTHHANGRIPMSDGSVALAISTLSMGFHYPIGLYAGELRRTMRIGGILIADCRKGTNQQTAFKRLCGHSEAIGEGVKHIRMRGVFG